MKSYFLILIAFFTSTMASTMGTHLAVSAKDVKKEGSKTTSKPKEPTNPTSCSAETPQSKCPKNSK
ncbi:MAG: hypothetical protein WC635_06535 [Bacteriovorax sp.]